MFQLGFAVRIICSALLVTFLHTVCKTQTWTFTVACLPVSERRVSLLLRFFISFSCRCRAGSRMRSLWLNNGVRKGPTRLSETLFAGIQRTVRLDSCTLSYFASLVLPVPPVSRAILRGNVC